MASIKLGPNGELTEDTQIQFTLEERIYQMRSEIERLREALRHYVRECDCNGGTYYEDDHITGKTLIKDCPKCEPARTALEEKE